MNKIELKPGLYLKGNFAYISDPRIASCFLSKIVVFPDNETDIYSLWKVHMHGYVCVREITANCEYVEYPLKIHKSIFKSEVEPVAGASCFCWYEDTRKDCLHYFPTHKMYESDMARFTVTIKVRFAKASEITLNLNIEKLNQLWDWLYGEGK